MATLSQYLFVTGALLLLFAFVLGVAHTALLAAGRRSVASAGRAGPALASAGYADAALSLTGIPAASGVATTSAISHGLTWASFLLLAGSLLARAVVVERGPWGNMYEFSIAFAVGIMGGYLFLQRRYPIRTIAFLPLGVALFLVGYASTLPASIEPLVPALDNPALLTVHVAMAMIAYGMLRHLLRRRRGLPAAGRDRSLRLATRPQGARRGGVSVRSSSASRSSPPCSSWGPTGPPSPGAATGAGTPRRPRRW